MFDIPEVTEQMRRVVLRVGGESIARGQQQIDLLLDAFIVEYFKAKAGEQGYQALMHQVLAVYVHQGDRA